MLSNPRILVCTDFKPTSDLALKSAEVIRKKVGGEIHTIHISDVSVQLEWIAQESSYIYPSEKLSFDLLKSLNKMMSDQLSRCEVSGTSHVLLGSTYKGIMENIRTLKPDLVMLGHTGHHDEMFDLGGLVSKVVASAQVPVFVIKKYLMAPLGKVAGLVDSSDMMKSVISATEEFSFVLSAEPEIISLWRSTASTLHQDREIVLKVVSEEIAKNLDVHSKCKIRVDITNEKQVAHSLLDILEKDHTDLAIMKRHQRNILERMFIGSETRRMLEIFGGNILVLPPNP